ncbi:cytochrome c [Candidatus Venteria ishoeyi]|uniref:c-type cytochrome n=1 Tax=Candidatus Venteria ishoeyi TaxID=1899563 RepID=UPI0025A68650|nr:cytochrome c [Candidatus Venteria ishoeyi]MDM8545384.1 cytochrome c [Candidatus Venteria ishoeyi]
MTRPYPQQAGGVLLTVLAFCLGLTLVFTLIANLLPQVEGEAPVEKEVDLGALTMDSFVALGETLFKGKGTCTLCHNNMGRAPDILASNMVQDGENRLKDERYKGKASDVEAYLRESMLDPSIYVVKGFGKKGSNDSVSPMPVVDKAPILLSQLEMDAVIAFMQAKDGNDVTVELPKEAPAEVAKTETSTAAPVESASTPEAVAAKYGCQACHSMMATESPVGPSLVDAKSRLNKEAIRQSIIDPAAVIAEGFVDMMPKDFGDKMTIRELDLIVDYLSADAAAPTPQDAVATTSTTSTTGENQ